MGLGIFCTEYVFWSGVPTGDRHYQTVLGINGSLRSLIGSAYYGTGTAVQVA